MKPAMCNALAVSFASVLLTACSSNPMKVALTEMGTSSGVEYGSYNYRYMRTINITGLSPEESIGTLTADPDRRTIAKFFTVIRDFIFPNDFPDMMNARIGSEETVVHVSTTCKQAITCMSVTEAVTLKDNIQKREVLIGRLASIGVDIKTLQLAEIGLDIKINPEDKELILAAIKQKFLENSIIKNATISNYKDAFSSVISSLRENEKTIDEELNTTVKSINKPGVIVSNWKLEKSASANGNAPGVNGSVSSNKDKYGYVIFINPIQLTLEIGSDMGKILHSMKNKPHMNNIYSQDRVYLTTYQMRVSELIYSESLESIIGANIDVKVDEITKTLQPLLGAGVSLDTLSGLKAQIAVEYKKYSFSSNQGMLSFRSDGDVNIPGPYKLSEIVKGKKKSDEETKSYFEMLSQSRAVINQRVSFNEHVKTYPYDPPKDAIQTTEATKPPRHTLKSP